MYRFFRKSYKMLYDYYNLYSLIFVRPQFNGKIFCIGFNKTGTSSLGKSFEMLGLKNTSFNWVVWNKYYKYNRIDKILNYTAKFDTTDDLPWLKEDLIPVLDKAFPNSKFVYLTRDEVSWKKSLYNWNFDRFGKYPNLEKRWQEYKSHERFVLDYFEGRSSKDFIILDIKDPKGFSKLADFIGKDTKIDCFPHFNKAK